MPLDEMQTIQIMADELATLDRIESGIKGDSVIQKSVDKYAVGASLYSNPARLQALINELEEELATYLGQANRRGKILSKSQITRFLEESERRDIAQNQLRLIDKANSRQAERRLKLSLMELQKEAGVLKSDIAIFKERAKIAGFSDKDSLRQLVIASKDKNGIAQGFARRAKRVTVAAVRREQNSAKIAERRKLAEKNALWVWIAVSTKPCPDCTARAGVSLTYDQWIAKGLPGAGRTVCEQWCRCDLVPEPMAEEMFPEVRSFEWNPKDTVLATKSEVRTFQAKSNQSRLKA
jgi:hypothetical protein